jgi:hypothetical protein
VSTAHAADDGKESLSLAACPIGLAIRDFDAMSPRDLRFSTLKRCPTMLGSSCSNQNSKRLPKSPLSMPALMEGYA